MLPPCTLRICKIHNVPYTYRHGFTKAVGLTSSTQHSIFLATSTTPLLTPFSLDELNDRFHSLYKLGCAATLTDLLATHNAILYWDRCRCSYGMPSRPPSLGRGLGTRVHVCHVIIQHKVDHGRSRPHYSVGRLQAIS